MSKVRTWSLLALLCLISTTALAEGRKVINMNFGWRFHLGDIANAQAKDFDDAGWRTVDLPHDFQIEQPWVAPDASERPDNSDPGANIRSRLSSRGFKEMGRGWYRLHFTPDETWRGRRVLVDFEGIMYVGDVYLNGQLVGKTDYGYVGFEVDLTRQLRWGEDNVAELTLVHRRRIVPRRQLRGDRCRALFHASSAVHHHEANTWHDNQHGQPTS